MSADTLTHYPRMKQTQARLVSSTRLKNGMALAQSGRPNRQHSVQSSHVKRLPERR